MKLPQVQYRAVESLGRSDLGAVANKANAQSQHGQALQAMTNAVAQVSADYIERQENSEYNRNIAEYSVEINEWMARNNAKKAYTSDDIPPSIPEDLVPRTEKYTDDNGAESERPRDYIPAHEVYPLLLAKKLEGMIKTRAEKISNPILRNSFVNKAQMNASESVMNATVAAEEAQRAYQFEEDYMSAGTAADAGNLAMAQFLVDNMEDLSPVAKEKLMLEMEGRVEVYEVSQSIRSSDPETIMTMASLLDDPNYSGSLSEKQRQSAIHDLKNRYDFLRNEYVTDQTKQHESFISDAFVGIEDGSFTLRNVEAGYELWKKNDAHPNSISGDERTRFRNAINQRNKAIKVQQDWEQMGRGIIANGGNRDNPDHQKAIDAIVEGENITDIRELERITIRSGGIMPQRLEDFLSAMSMHNAENGSEGIESAVQTFGRIEDMESGALMDLGKHVREVLGDTWFLTRTGMNTMDAYKVARENQQIKPEVRDQRLFEYNDLKPATSNIEILQKFMNDDDSPYGFEGGFTSGWGSVADPDSQMSAQFSGLVRNNYLRTGDINLSRMRAWKEIKGTYAPTGVGAIIAPDDLGDSVIKTGQVRPMKLSPESVMGVSTEEANQRLRLFAEEESLDFEKVMITSDDVTSRTGDSWAVWTIDPETTMPILHPKRWFGGKYADKSKEWSHAKAVQAQLDKEDGMLRIQIEAEKARGNPFWLSEQDIGGN